MGNKWGCCIASLLRHVLRTISMHRSRYQYVRQPKLWGSVLALSRATKMHHIWCSAYLIESDIVSNVMVTNHISNKERFMCLYLLFCNKTFNKTIGLLLELDSLFCITITYRELEKGAGGCSWLNIQLTSHNPDGQFKHPMIFEAPLMALRTAPSILGLAQKSPQIANFMLLSQTHLSSPPIEMAGKALPLQFYILSNTNKEEKIQLKMTALKGMA